MLTHCTLPLKVEDENEHQTHLRDPPDILPAILLAKPQIPIQAKPHIIPIEPVRRQAKLQEVLLERGRDGRFAARREACEPERVSLLAAESGALVVREGCVPGYISAREREGQLLVGGLVGMVGEVEGERGVGKADLRCCHFDGGSGMRAV